MATTIAEIEQDGASMVCVDLMDTEHSGQVFMLKQDIEDGDGDWIELTSDGAAELGKILTDGNKMKKVKNSHFCYGVALGHAFGFLFWSATPLTYGVAALFVAAALVCRAIEE